MKQPTVDELQALIANCMFARDQLNRGKTQDAAAALHQGDRLLNDPYDKVIAPRVPRYSARMSNVDLLQALLALEKTAAQALLTGRL